MISVLKQNVSDTPLFRDPKTERQLKLIPYTIPKNLVFPTHHATDKTPVLLNKSAITVKSVLINHVKRRTYRGWKVNLSKRCDKRVIKSPR